MVFVAIPVEEDADNEEMEEDEATEVAVAVAVCGVADAERFEGTVCGELLEATE